MPSPEMLYCVASPVISEETLGPALSMADGSQPLCSQMGQGEEWIQGRPGSPAGSQSVWQCSGLGDLHVLHLLLQGDLFCFLFAAFMLLLLLLRWLLVNRCRLHKRDQFLEPWEGGKSEPVSNL